MPSWWIVTYRIGVMRSMSDGIGRPFAHRDRSMTVPSDGGAATAGSVGTTGSGTTRIGGA